MSQYIVKRSFYEGNGLHEEGNSFSHEDSAYVEKLLADGNIEAVTEGGSESTSPLGTEQQGSDSPENPVSQPETTPEAPQAPEAPSVTETQPVQPVEGQPTPSEIEETLSNSGLGSEDDSQKIDVQIS